MNPGRITGPVRPAALMPGLRAPGLPLVPRPRPGRRAHRCRPPGARGSLRSYKDARRTRCSCASTDAEHDVEIKVDHAPELRAAG